MPERIEFTLDSGGTVVVESPDEGVGTSPAGRISLAHAGATLREALAPVTRAASDMLDSLHGLPRRPDEVQIEFGVKLDGTMGALIATASTGVHLNITLKWSPASAKPVPSTASADPGGPTSR
ncbi:CU044_2847 family protein [Streptantibioticus rubrisoli]|uniref:Trypsin-co-occurring domain-containing protein n=1 Tax=Streptantibioticus rubrisoli TaxID=1387313 RepID=A0ABT1PFC4_9ACTN|nr:CU044_2847 family protein [Streptantibioticus rubrisoli]MCQ4044039.1 hypothetical protein [Streptantibioticus rubrisoli]